MNAVEFAIKVRKLQKRIGGKWPTEARDAIRTATETEYRKILQALERLVAECEKATTARRESLNKRASALKPSTLRRLARLKAKAGNNGANGASDERAGDG